MFPGNRETVRGARPPALSAPGEKPAATPEPVEEREAAEVPPNPAAVSFRSESETCGHCTYMNGSHCEFPLVAQEVQAGDSCAAFEARMVGQSEPSTGGLEYDGDTDEV